jgi:hypothetical protein
MEKPTVIATLFVRIEGHDHGASIHVPEDVTAIFYILKGPINPVHDWRSIEIGPLHHGSEFLAAQNSLAGRSKLANSEAKQPHGQRPRKRIYHKDGAAWI